MEAGGDPERSVAEYTDLVDKRADVLATLEDDRLDLRTVAERTENSRSTVNRAVRSLEEAGLVRRTDGRYELTAFGELALDHHRTYRRRWGDLLGARDLLDALPADAAVDIDAVAGGDTVVAPEETPYWPLQRLETAIDEAERCRIALPVLADPRQLRLLYEHVVTDGAAAELLVSEDLRASLIDQFPRRLAAMADRDFELLVGDVPPFGLVLTEGGDGPSLALVVFEPSGGVAGVLHNEAEPAVRWGRERYERLREDTEAITDTLRESPDGGVIAEPGGAASPRSSGVPPHPVLEREGFVRLSEAYFLDNEAADPMTAWRAGLDIAEVHTGYAVERTGDDDRALCDRLLEALVDDRDCAVVGPPGSGKSTTAKRVACAWYDRGRGLVFYRERDRGVPFRSVEQLVAVVEAVEGCPLIVVEDAVRPEADAVFEAIERVRGSDDADASFLLDAREREWRDPPGDRPIGIDRELRVETMPRLLDRDCERLIERFERTTGETVPVPADRLRETVRQSVSGADGEASAPPGEILQFLHRLTLLTDPLAEERTTLEAEVAAVYESIADIGGTALDVAVLVNLLNAAGVSFGRAELRAVGDDPAAVETALRRLEGRVLFSPDDGDRDTYRTVHEAWSVAFLGELLDVEGESAARDRVERCVTAFLDDAPVGRSGGIRLDPYSGAGADVGDPPERTALPPGPDRNRGAEIVERLLALARERPKLAVLFGDADGRSILPPGGSDGRSPPDCSVQLARAFLDRGAYDRAAAAFARLPTDGEHAVDRALGLGETAHRRGDFDRANAYAEWALRLAREREAPEGVARALVRLGAVAERRGDYDRAREHFEESLATFRDLGDRRRIADLHRRLGTVAIYRTEYDRARDHLTESLSIARSVGDRLHEAETLNALGVIAMNRSDYDRARERFEESLAIGRERGDRRREADALNNLGIVARDRGDYDRAEECYERSLQINREIGNREGQTNPLLSLGEIDRKRGNYDRAREYLERGRAIEEELGNRRGRAVFRLGLAELACDRGAYDRARRHGSAALETFAAIGDDRKRGSVLETLGRAARGRGDRGSARERLRAALEAFDDVGDTPSAVDVLEELAALERAAGNTDRARTHCERALERLRRADAPLEDRRDALEDRLRRIDGGNGDG